VLSNTKDSDSECGVWPTNSSSCVDISGGSDALLNDPLSFDEESFLLSNVAPEDP